MYREERETQKEKKVRRKNKKRGEDARETKDTHTDTETRMTGNKSGVCVRRHTTH